jgi:hypothetical protein
MDEDKENGKASKASSSSAYQVPWIEKYRPQLLVDIVGNEETLVRLSAIAKDGNLPNLILCGPPGTGKVSILLLLLVCLSFSMAWTYMMLFLQSLPPYFFNICIINSYNNRLPAYTHWLVNCWATRTRKVSWN